MAVQEVGQIFICKKCGNEVIVTKVGKGTLVCCGKEMTLIDEGTDQELDSESEEEESE